MYKRQGLASTGIITRSDAQRIFITQPPSVGGASIRICLLYTSQILYCSVFATHVNLLTFSSIRCFAPASYTHLKPFCEIFLIFFIFLQKHENTAYFRDFFYVLRVKDVYKRQTL